MEADAVIPTREAHSTNYTWGWVRNLRISLARSPACRAMVKCVCPPRVSRQNQDLFVRYLTRVCLWEQQIQFWEEDPSDSHTK